MKGNMGKLASAKQGAAPKPMSPATKQVAPKKSIIEQMRAKNRVK